MMKGTCNLYNIIAIAEMLLRKCCVYIIKGMVKMMKEHATYTGS